MADPNKRREWRLTAVGLDSPYCTLLLLHSTCTLFNLSRGDLGSHGGSEFHTF